jgi:hypothetical protein
VHTTEDLGAFLESVLHPPLQAAQSGLMLLGLTEEQAAAATAAAALLGTAAVVSCCAAYYY